MPDDEHRAGVSSKQGRGALRRAGCLCQNEGSKRLRWSGREYEPGDKVHPDLRTVIELQQVDSRIAELNSQIAALPSQIQTLEAQLNEFLHAYEEHKTRLGASQKERRDLEAEIQVIQARIAKHKDQLYQVKTNEQYKAMLHEIGGEEANIRRIEDSVLEKMLEAEQLEKYVKDAEARLEGEKSRVASAKAKLEAERQRDIDERSGHERRRAELAGALSPSVRALYERMLPARNGVAVVMVRDGSCGACHVLLRPQAYNEVRQNDAVMTCENCGRILYYIEPPPPEPEEASRAGSAAPH
jgi:uncharacterized protein